MKYNPFSGTGKEVLLFEKELFSSRVEKRGDEFYFLGRKIAERKNLFLIQDPTYRTQFHNELLSKVVDQLGEDFVWKLTDVFGNPINTFTNLPSLKREYSSLVYETEPVNIPVYLSAVVYEGPVGEDVLLKDGSVQMDDEYFPSLDQDIVTKKYIDSYLTKWAAEREKIKNFEITLNGKELPRGYCYLNNVELPVIYIKKYPLGDIAHCKLSVEPFAISNDWVNPKIAIYINSNPYFVANIKDIVDDVDDDWKLESSENIYTEIVDNIYWKNKYVLDLNTTSGGLSYYLRDNSPYVRISVKVWEEGGSEKSSEEKTFGVDYYIDEAECHQDVSWIEEQVQQYRTHWVSGVPYFENGNIEYPLNIRTSIFNNFLQYYRPKVVAKLFAVYGEEEVLLKDISLSYHNLIEDRNTYVQNSDIKYKIGINALRLYTYNLSGEVLNVKEVPFNSLTDTSDETIRVTTPDGTISNPVEDYGAPWDSTKILEPYDMFSRNGEYTSEDPNSALCLRIVPEGCYSHCVLDLETDGEIYLKSEGNTEWLDCQKHKHSVLTPLTHEDGCLVNNGFYSFGKVIYDSPVFIRVIKATKAKFNKIELG